jgi:two-component system, chemotaxis family, chemotaxis protein CheY
MAGIKLYTEPETALKEIKEEVLADENTTTVLFLDINMPSMTGWEFLESFKDFRTEIRQRFTIYILSSSVDDRDKEMADSNPFVSGFLSKPLPIDVINNIFIHEDAE